MPVQITILGLGQIGASIGLALDEHRDKLVRTGFDRDPLNAREALKRGAVDRVVHTFHEAVAEADLVLLCLPAGELRETLETIAPSLKPGAVVMDTAPLKAAMTAWCAELLPSGCHYVGLVPVINPAYLQTAEEGLEAARADLFHKGMLLIASSGGDAGAGEAVRLAGDLARLIGAEAFYADLAEADGLAAAVHVLPQLAAAALTRAVSGQPGWRDRRKVAGRPYAEATRVREDAAALATSAAHNAENVARVLDEYIAALQALRELIARSDRPGLEQQLQSAAEAREKWLQERERGNWIEADAPGPDIPTVGETFQRLFVGGLFKKKKS